MTDSPDNRCPECDSVNITTRDGKVTCDDCGLVLADDVKQTERLTSTIDWRNQDALDRPITESVHSRREERRRERENQADKIAELKESGPEVEVEWECPGYQLLTATPKGVILKDSSSLCNVDPTTGETRWSRQLPESDGQSIRSPTIKIRDDSFVLTIDDELIVIDAATGEERWRNKLRTQTSEDSGRSSIAMSDDAVFVPGDNGSLAAFSQPDGSLLWESSSVQEGLTRQSKRISQIEVVGDLIVTVDSSDDSSVIAQDAATGEFIWEFVVRDYTSLLSAAAGHILVGNRHSGKLYALNPQTGKQRWRYTLPEYEIQGSEWPPEIFPPVDVREIAAGLLITGDGYYSAIVDPETGEERFEISVYEDLGERAENAWFEIPLTGLTDTHERTLLRSMTVIQAYHFSGSENSLEEALVWRFTDLVKNDTPPHNIPPLGDARVVGSAQQVAVLLGHFSGDICVLSLDDGELLRYIELNGQVKAIEAVDSCLIVEHSQDESCVRAYRL